MEVTVIGAWITVKLNGRNALRVYDATYSTGGVALAGRNPSNIVTHGMDIRADEFSVINMSAYPEEF